MKLRDSRLWISIATVATLVLGLAAVALAAFANWKFGLPTGDKTVVINTVVATVSCLLVAVAGVVALIAYLAASGRPDLDIDITFPFSFPNKPVFVADDSQDHPAGWRTITPFKQVQAKVRLKNASDYAGRNPGVRIELEGLGGLNPQPGWESLEFANTVGLTTIQWDGDIVHGCWSRTLPDLNFEGVQELVPGAAALVVTIAADGIRPVERRMPVRVLSRAEYESYSAERAESLEGAG